MLAHILSFQDDIILRKEDQTRKCVNIVNKSPHPWIQ